MTTPVLLFECDVFDTANGVLRTIRRASEAYNHRSAPGHYPDGLASDAQAVASLRRSVWSSEGEFGAGKLDASPIDILNTGELDWLVADRAAYGHTARYLMLPDRTSPYSTAVALGTGVVDGAAYLADRVSFRWRDPVAFLLDKAAQRRQYGGTNALPNGVDGVDDIKGQWVPEWWGNGGGANVPAVCVNTSKWVFQLSNGPMTPTAVYDKTSKLVAGTTQRTGLNVLLTTNPVAGGWDWYSGPEGTFVRVLAKPTGELTVDGYEGATVADRTVAQVAKRMLAAWGVTLPTATCAAMDALQSGEAGIWLGTSEEQRRDAINRLLATAGMVLWVDKAGAWRLGRPGIPTGTPVATFRIMERGRPAQSATDGDILEFEWLSPGNGEDQPAYLCTLNHTRNYSVGSKDSLAEVSWTANPNTRGLQWLTQEWRTESDTDPAVLEAAPLARQTTEDTLFTAAAVTKAEAARRLAMRKRHGPRRARLRATFPPRVAAVVDLMEEVRVAQPRWGMAGGRGAIVYDLDVNWRLGVADLYLYF